MDYRFEDIREFFVRRWTITDIISVEEYHQLKNRTWIIDADRAEQLRWFIKGWKAAKS